MFANVRPVDQRMHPRRATHAPGRYMLADKREYRCTVVDISDGGLALAGLQRGQIGEKVIVYADGLRRFAGEIVRHTERGFALKFLGVPQATDGMPNRVRP